MKRRIAVFIYTANRFGSCVDEESNNIDCHIWVPTYSVNRDGSCIDEELNNIGCHIFVATCKVKRHEPIIINRTGGIRKIFEKALNYSLVDSFIIACLMEEELIITQ
eukprot:scaffold10306_cov75-Skeletonema_marinoi.AAC.2